MAFSSSIILKNKIFGSRKIVVGTYTNASGDTGGDIDTGLKRVEFLVLQPKGSSVIATAPSVNETFPCDGSAVTIVTADNEDGYWFAFGK